MNSYTSFTFTFNEVEILLVLFECPYRIAKRFDGDGGSRISVSCRNDIFPYC